jgi:hypothetical protein
MRVLKLSALIAILTACGGSGGDNGIVNPPPAKKPDPFVTVRVRNLMDTTTAAGRADWHVYAILTGPYDALNGIALQGYIGLDDVRLHHDVLCVGVSADSVGQRLLTILALADTTTSATTPDASFSAAVTAWYGGARNLPASLMPLTFPATDAWLSVQYAQGHGLTPLDPIKWGFDWTASGTATFYERTDTDAECNRF